MNFYNLIKFRKLFLILLFISIVYLLQKFVRLSRSLQSGVNLKKQKVEIKESRIERQRHPDKIAFGEHLRVSKYEKNCGNAFKCDENDFSFFLNTGYPNRGYPKLCVDDKYLQDRLFNRGLNVVIIDNTTKTVTSVQNYDIHLKDPTNLETQLLSLRPGDKIVLFTFDESPKLSKVAKLLINELGSVHIQNVQFRTTWLMVSEKQIKGYSPFEEIYLPVEKGQLGSPHLLRLCIPFQIKGDFARVDQSLFGNKDRVEYCRQFKNKWKAFCDDNVVNEPLYVSSPASAATTASSALQSSPILVFTDSVLSDENDMLTLTLETVFRQAGVLPGNVLVFYFQESTNELQSLASLFRFKSHKIDLGSPRWFDEIRSRIEREFHGAPKQFVLIFGNLILTADFLNYFSQLVPLLWYPNSGLSFVSAWNDDCYNSMCTDEALVTRVQAKKFSFKHSLAIKFDRQFFSLLDRIVQLNSLGNQSIRFDDLNSDGLVPDFPRVLVAKEISDVFLDQSNDQKISLLENVKINRIDSLVSVESYTKSLAEFRANSLTLRGISNLVYYLENRHNNTSANITVFVSSSGLPEICTIFHLRSCLCNYHVDGLGDVLRFNFNRHLSVLLIGN